MESAITHCTKGIGLWDWASNDQGVEPDVVIATAGDVPTLKSLAATALLRSEVPGPEDSVHQCGGSLQAPARLRIIHMACPIAILTACSRSISRSFLISTPIPG